MACNMKRPMQRASDDPVAESSVMRQVLEYLVSHPDANDTMEGIRGFWLPHGGSRIGDTALRGVLESLVAHNWLTVRPMAARGSCYGLNKARLIEMRRFLAGDGEPCH